MKSAMPYGGGRASELLRFLRGDRVDPGTVADIADAVARAGRGRKRVLSIVSDALTVVIALWFAYSLRLGEAFSDVSHTWYQFLMLPVVTVLLFHLLDVYRWVVRSSNAKLFQQIANGCVLSAICFALLSLPVSRDGWNTPRSLFVIYGMLLLIGTMGVRFAWRELCGPGRSGEPIAIYGTGQQGCQLARLLELSEDYRAVAFISDDANIIGSTLGGLTVLDVRSDNLRARLGQADVERVVLAMPRLERAEYRRKLEDLESLGLSVKTVPSIVELLSGTAGVDEIRDISIDDIIGRSEVVPDPQLLGGRVRGRTVLVTGGGGSIGSELCRQIMRLEPRRLIALDNCEANLYHVTEELRGGSNRESTISGASFRPFLCSVRDRARLRLLMSEERIDTVYHAAAYKHVPIVESHPDQGVEVNVFGTLALLKAALAHEVKDFVLISTDKAVRPTNAMGASKRVAELILQAHASRRPRTTISMVRFGNVLGSSGSVVPKFRRQIESGGPVTLTDPDVTRYFMTIPEAAQLVLQASSVAKGGDVFVLDMGEPVRIKDLATSMAKLYGKRVCEEAHCTGTRCEGAIHFVVEGLRPGEKMYEELFIGDGCERTLIPKVFTAEESQLSWEVLERGLAIMRTAIRRRDRTTLCLTLMGLALDERSASRAPVAHGVGGREVVMSVDERGTAVGARSRAPARVVMSEPDRAAGRRSEWTPARIARIG